MSIKSRVVVDEREKPSGIPRLLKELGLSVDFRMLETGDYILPGYAIERKEIHDLVRSVFSRRVFSQAQRLSDLYENPTLIVEGDIYGALEEISPSVFWGALATLAFDYGLSVFFTPNREQTARLIYILSRRKPAKYKGPLIRTRPKSGDAEDLKIQIVSSLPGVGPKLADRLLNRFLTVRRVFTATVAELSTVGGVGRKTAYKIKRILDSPYNPSVKTSRQLKLDDEAKGLKV
mgnify:FL=1